MKLTHTILALFVAVLALPMVAVGQDEDLSAEVARSDEVSKNTVVASRKSSAELRRDLWRSEDDFYSLYNKLNDDNLYDVRCTYEAPVGSRMKNQVCRPVFLSRAVSRGEVTRVTNLDTDPVMAEKMATFRQKVDTLISADPELQAAAVTFSTARAEYMAQSEESAKN
jgi:hypothetical protein